jgi:hypothetical protein
MTVERAETSYSMKGRLSKIKVDETQDIGQLSLYFSYMMTVSFIAGIGPKQESQNQLRLRRCLVIIHYIV